MITIEKITIATGKMKEMTTFYSSAFDISFKEIKAYGTSLHKGMLGSVEILLCPKEIAGITAIENTIQLTFLVQDVEKTFANAINNGGKEITPVKSALDTKLASVYDPDGNSIEITQKTNNERR